MINYSYKKKTHTVYVVGRGFISDTIANVGNFLLRNQDTIKGIAGIAGEVAKAGTNVAAATKEVMNAIKAKRALNRAAQKSLSNKSNEFLQQLANGGQGPSGSGFRLII